MGTNVFKEAKFFISVDSPQKLGDASSEIAFVGRSNVGKSSLLNALCGQNGLAKVSKTPGKTRAINVFSVEQGKWIVDLPGYGFAAVSEDAQKKWQHMIEYYISGRPSLETVFVLMDAYVGATKLDRQMLAWLGSIGVPYRVVANKIDRIPQPELEARRAEMGRNIEMAPEYIIWASARKGTGMDELRAAAAELLGL